MIRKKRGLQRTGYVTPNLTLTAQCFFCKNGFSHYPKVFVFWFPLIGEYVCLAGFPGLGDFDEDACDEARE